MEKKQLQVALTNGSTMTIEGYLFEVNKIQCLVHKCIENATLWAVTHIKSGLSVCMKFKSRTAAVNAAKEKLAKYNEQEIDEITKQKIGIFIHNKKTYQGEGIYVGRPSPLGNPFPDSEGRETCIQKYRAWLHLQLKSDGFNITQARAELERLVKIYKTKKRLDLICWCAPLPCHAEVIANAIRWMVGEEIKPYTWRK